MQETQTYYQEGCEDFSYADGIYNNFPVMRDTNNFNNLNNGPLSFVNYFNQWGPQRIVEPDIPPIDRNVQLLAIPNSIFPKRIVSLSQVPPPQVETNVTQLSSLNTAGTFQGNKFRWFGTLQQIRVPVSRALYRILGEKNWLKGGYYSPQSNVIAADPAARVGDNGQTAGVVMTQNQVRRVNGNQSSTTFVGEIFPIDSHNTVAAPHADKYTITASNQIIQPQLNDMYTVDEVLVTWNPDTDRPRATTKSFQEVKFPLLMSPQFKPWVCFRLITIKFKVSMNEWFQMSNELPYRLNTLFWNKQTNRWDIPQTVYIQWDRATSNSILAKPNPYGGTFKICKNKKLYINPFKGKIITNRIYSKKRGKIINTKMWQAGQAPIAGLADGAYPQYGYYSNGLYVSLLLGPLNIQRDFDSFTANILRQYFVIENGAQEQLEKGTFNYKWDTDGIGHNAYYQKSIKGRNLPGFPNWCNNIEIPYGIQLYGDDEILIKTQTKYCEY